MNKAKFLLSAIALVAVVGVVTAAKSNPNYKLYTSNLPSRVCVEINATLVPNGQTLNYAFIATVPGEYCTLFATIYLAL